MRSLTSLILTIFIGQVSAGTPVVSDQLAQQYAEKCVALAEMQALQQGLQLNHPTQSMIVSADPSISIVILFGTISSPWRHGAQNSELIRKTHTCQNGEIQ